MSDVTTSHRRVSFPLVIATIGIFAMFLFIVLVARTPSTPLSAVADVPAEEQWKMSSEGRQQRLVEVRGSARSAANEYAWLDREAGVVRLPINEAVRLTIEEINGQRR